MCRVVFKYNTMLHQETLKWIRCNEKSQEVLLIRRTWLALGRNWPLWCWTAVLVQC